MQSLLSLNEIKSAEKFTIENLGIPELDLMEFAARAAYRSLTSSAEFLSGRRGVILVGAGNNGGDAAALARILSEQSSGPVNFCIALLPSTKRSAALLFQLERLQSLDVPRLELTAENVNSTFDSVGWVVDGLFGVGLSRPIEGVAASVITYLNTQSLFVLSLDVPSGLSAQTGKSDGPTVKASTTLTFGFIKQGLVTGDAADFVGELLLDSIDLGRPLVTESAPRFLFDQTGVALPPRLATSHKGTFGHVYVWCGVPQTEGAAGIATVAALRTGCGLVTLWGESAGVSELRKRLRLEVMTADYQTQIFTVKNAVGVFGPGMGIRESSWEILKTALASNWRLVIDGDALTLLSQNREAAQKLIAQRSAATILTPHPKEASRLLGESVADIERDRYRSVKEIANQFTAHVILKGKGTLTCGPGNLPTYVITAGDTGLAKGGSGDLLSGIVGSLAGQPGDLQNNLSLAIYVHGRASELLSARFGTERSSLASEIADEIPNVFRELECPAVL